MSIFTYIRKNLVRFYLGATILGVILALVMGDQAVVLKPLGTIFTRLLSMIVPVLVFFTISSAFASVGDTRKLASWASKIIGWFVLTGLIGIFLGIAVGLIFKPGIGITLPNATFETSKLTADTFIDWLPKNFLGCIAEGNTIQIVFLAIFVGIAVVTMPDGKAKSTLVNFLASGQALIFQLVSGIMCYAPIGIAALMATSLASLKESLVVEMGSFLAAYSIAFVLQVVIAYMIFPYIFAKINPFRFTRKIFPALITAFTTTSSAATLPVNMECVKAAGVDKEMADFGVPLGVTFNMDSMAIEIPLYTMLGMYAVGTAPTISQLFLFVIMGIAFSIGCAGVPGGGIAIAIILMNAFGLPLEVVGWIAAVFYYLDITGTPMNIWGDAVCTAIVASREGKLDWNKMNS